MANAVRTDRLNAVHQRPPLTAHAPQQQVGACLSLALLDDGGAALAIDPVALPIDEQPEDRAAAVLLGSERKLNVR
jgi:hypothetical protein